MSLTQPPPKGIRPNRPLHLPAFGKEVEGQGAGPVLDKRDGLLQRIKGQQREDRAEDFLLHHRGVGGGGKDQGGGHPAAAGLTAAEYLTALSRPPGGGGGRR